MKRSTGLAVLILFAGAVTHAVAQGNKVKVLLDLAVIAKGKRATIEKIFGKPTSVRKNKGISFYTYKPGNFRKVTAYYDKEEVNISITYKPKDDKDWKTIIAQFGLSVNYPSDPEAVRKFFPWMDSIQHFNELSQGSLSIWREEKKGSKQNTGWVSVNFTSAHQPF